MPLSHFSREPCSQGHLLPTCVASQRNGHVGRKTVRIVHGEQVFIGNDIAVLRNRFELGLDDVRTFSQHLSVPLLFQGQDGEQASFGLFVEVATQIDVKMMLCKVRKRNVDAEFVSHPKDPSGKHACEVARLCIRRNQTIAEHVAQGVKVVGDGIDVGQWLGYGRELFGCQFHAAFLEFGQKEVDQLVAVNPRLDVHDAV